MNHKTQSNYYYIYLLELLKRSRHLNNELCKKSNKFVNFINVFFS